MGSSLNPSSEVGQVVLSGIKIPQGLEKAVAAVLGERARYLVSAIPKDYFLTSKQLLIKKAAGVLREVADQEISSSD